MSCLLFAALYRRVSEPVLRLVQNTPKELACLFKYGLSGFTRAARAQLFFPSAIRLTFSTRTHSFTPQKSLAEVRLA